MRKVALYARQSEDVAAGVDRQLARGRQLAEARGWTVAGEYVDNDVSAFKSRGAKTEWARMVRDLHAGAADVVIAVDLDRLLRDTRDLATIIDTGARVLTVDGELDLTTADGEFRATMLAGLARFEVRRKSERQKRANEDRATRVRRPNPGRRRYGYETDGLTPRAAEAAVVERMFRHVAGGGSLRSIAQALAAEGVSPGTAREWNSRFVRDILRSPHYAGAFRYRGEVVESEAVTPIVDRETWEEVQAVLDDPTRRTTPGPGVKHLASGLAECGVCGGRMVYMRTYRCKADASHPSIVKATLDARLRHEVARAVATYTGELLGGQAPAGEVAALVAAHKRNEEAAAATLADRDEGLVTAQVARARLVALKDEREAIERRLGDARRESSALATLSDLAAELRAAGGGAAVEGVAEAFDRLGLEDQRELVRTLLRVTVDKGRGNERVHVEHLEARWLNPWGVED